MSDLKPCPFCGGKAVLICVPGCFKKGLSTSGWLVKCLNGCVNQMPYGSDHDAIEAWNRRAKLERTKGKWNTYYHSDIELSHSCNQCGYSAPYQMIGGEVFQKKWNFCPSCGADMRGERP